MYAKSWWQRQRKTSFTREKFPTDVCPPFGVAHYQCRYGSFAAFQSPGNEAGSSDPSQESFLFNGPTASYPGASGIGSISWPAIARVRKDVDLHPGTGLNIAENFELDYGTLLECIGVFDDRASDHQLALVAPRRKTCDVGPSITLMFGVTPSGLVDSFMTLSDAEVIHESYSNIAVAKSDVVAAEGRIRIETHSSGAEQLILPSDGMYGFSHSAVASNTPGIYLVFQGRWPPPSYPELPGSTIVVISSRSNFSNLGLESSSGMTVLPCIGGMGISVHAVISEDGYRGFTLSVTRLGPLQPHGLWTGPIGAYNE